ncbi:MAG: chemotaxis protein CheD [Candidatus Omnitrophica bacterium]|nr:chemotaxis protein CheD [Candidatus Omnitrophota bacterium]
MADMQVAQSPAVLSSLGIGSCVGIALYDSLTKIGGLAHIMLPDIESVRNKSNRAKFANTAIPDLLNKMIEAGADHKRIRAKITGGAHMFGFAKTNKVFNIGERNIETSRETLKQLQVPLLSEDVGGTYGRSVFFYLETGNVKIRTVAHGESSL